MDCMANKTSDQLPFTNCELCASTSKLYLVALFWSPTVEIFHQHSAMAPRDVMTY